MLLVLSEIVLPLLVSFVLGWVVMGWLTWSWRRIPVPEIEWRKLLRRAERAESDLAAMKDERRALVGRLDELLRIRALAVEALTAADQDVSQLEQRIAADQERIGALEAELAAMTDQRQRLEVELEAAASPPRSRDREPSDDATVAATEVTEAAEVARLQAELVELQAWTSELEDEYEAMDAEIAEVRSRLADAEARALAEAQQAVVVGSSDGPVGPRNDTDIGPADEHQPRADGPVAAPDEASKAA